MSGRPLVLNDAAAASLERQREVARVRLIEEPVYNTATHDPRRIICNSIQAHEVVLDIGKSIRDEFESIVSKAKSVQTLDISDFGDYPDLIADICQSLPEEYHEKYDVVIALGTLNCVYDPQAMIDNIMTVLKPGGRAYVYAPFCYQYSAPADQSFQDNYRFSRDGIAYLMRDFVRIELQPIRGQYSTVANLLPSWKRRIEPHLGPALGRLLDRFSDPKRNILNSSGYIATGHKAG